jgi:hypothetical protein
MSGKHDRAALARIEQKVDHLHRLLHDIIKMEKYQMERMEDWEKALQDDTDATSSLEASNERLYAQIAALNIPDPRLAAILEGFKANTARTLALALRNTTAAPPNPEPLPPPVPVVDPTTGQPFPEPTA